jgi:D-beta-D-heptose 7-phosphate kinase/D-beta-D-heptose 1-phosphate adenosyltransferase
MNLGMQITKTIWINGCFDILHRGHLELFKFAKQQGDYLVVGIDTDERVKFNKGENRPINNQNDRKFFLECIKFVDKVVLFGSDESLEEAVYFYKPDIMIVGSDYKNKNVIGSQHAKKLIFFDRVGGFSTTKILEKT